MAEVRVIEIFDKNTWESFILKHPEANFLHSWYWGEFQKKLGRKIVRSGFYLSGKLLGIMLVIVEEA